MLNVITNTLALDNEFFIKGSGVYFCGIYEDTLLKGVSPADFHCWHYWGKSSSSCYMGGIRLRGADAASFQALNYAYAMDISAVYTTSGRIAGATHRRSRFWIMGKTPPAHRRDMPKIKITYISITATAKLKC